LHSALSVTAAFFSTVRPFVIVQSSSFLPSFLSVTGEDLMTERLGSVATAAAALVFLWFFPRRPIASDMQLLSPSRFRVLSIDRKTNLSLSVSIVIECGGILNLTQPHTKP